MFNIKWHYSVTYVAKAADVCSISNLFIISLWFIHRHLSKYRLFNTYLVYFSSSVNGRSKRKRKKQRSLLTIKTGASSQHITKLQQSIFLRCLWVYSCQVFSAELKRNFLRQCHHNIGL